MKKHNGVPTAFHQLNRLFMLLLVGALLVVNLTFVVVASNLVYRYADDQAEKISDDVFKQIPDTHDWSLLDAYIARQDDDAVAVTLPSGKTVYSDDGHKIFHRMKGRHYGPLAVTKKGIYCMHDGRHHGYRVRVAINVDDLLHLVVWLVIMMVLINLLAVIISRPFIRRIARRYTQPLWRMDTEVAQLAPGTTEQLTVPDQPREVSRLARSFNQLLTRQHETIQREQRFVADASHELKTPLATIRGHLGLIKRHGQDHPELVAKSLNYIEEAAQRMQTLVNELLEFGRQEQVSGETNLVPLLQAEVKNVRGQYQREITVTAPSKVAYPMLPADFRRVAHNLLDNAAKYSPVGSPIIASLLSDSEQVIFRVADQGRGIASQNRRRVLERFFREDPSRSNTVPGSGLGLAIVNEVVEKYHGKIAIRANKPQGTVVVVTWPKMKKSSSNL